MKLQQNELSTNNIDNRKCNNNCSCCQSSYCSKNPDGEKGQCNYFRQCGVTAFYCKH